MKKERVMCNYCLSEKMTLVEMKNLVIYRSILFSSKRKKTLDAMNSSQ